MLAPPIAVMLPPSVAALLVTPVAVGEVTVGAVAAPALARRPISVCAYGFSACGLV